jgi:hypothetical protein
VRPDDEDDNGMGTSGEIRREEREREEFARQERERKALEEAARREREEAERRRRDK